MSACTAYSLDRESGDDHSTVREMAQAQYPILPQIATLSADHGFSLIRAGERLDAKISAHK